MKRYTEDYIRKVMNFKDSRIELTEQQQRFLKMTYQELHNRIIGIYNKSMFGCRPHHEESSWGESIRLCSKASSLNNIISLNSYDFNERTLLLRLRNYHLKKVR